MLVLRSPGLEGGTGATSAVSLPEVPDPSAPSSARARCPRPLSSPRLTARPQHPVLLAWDSGHARPSAAAVQWGAASHLCLQRASHSKATTTIWHSFFGPAPAWWLAVYTGRA